MNLEREMNRMARNLLKRDPLRRGPFRITDDELREIIRATSRYEQNGDTA